MPGERGLELWAADPRGLGSGDGREQDAALHRLDEAPGNSTCRLGLVDVASGELEPVELVERILLGCGRLLPSWSAAFAICELQSYARGERAEAHRAAWLRHLDPPV